MKGGCLCNQSSSRRWKNTPERKPKNKVPVRMLHQDRLSLLSLLNWLFWNFRVGCVGWVDSASLRWCCRAGMWTLLHPRNILHSPFLASVSGKEMQNKVRVPGGVLRHCPETVGHTPDQLVTAGSGRFPLRRHPLSSWCLWSVPGRGEADDFYSNVMLWKPLPIKHLGKGFVKEKNTVCAKVTGFGVKRAWVQALTLEFLTVTWHK